MRDWLAGSGRKKGDFLKKFFGIFSRAAESTALAVGIVLFFITINSYVNKKPNSVQEETSDIQSSFPDIHQIMK
jgi:hypothetical protein